MAPLRMRRAIAFWFVVLHVVHRSQHAQAQLQGSLFSFPPLPTTTTSASSFLQPTAMVIYKNGLASGWRDVSYGCTFCDWADRDNARDTSVASFAGEVAAWGALVIASDNAFSANSMLDFWAKGSGLTAVSVYLEDSTNRRFSKDIRFSSATMLSASTAVQIYGSDPSGWIHLQLSLSALVDEAVLKTSTFMTGGGWDRVIFKDVSGMGFTLQLDDMKLIQASALSTVKLASADPLLGLGLAMNATLPTFGIDQLKKAADPSRYIMRLRRGVTPAALSSICAELSGAPQPGGRQRFSGFCDSSSMNWINAALTAQSSVDWRFVSITVKSQLDLQAMRNNLGNMFEYFEVDYTARATPMVSVPKEPRNYRRLLGDISSNLGADTSGATGTEDMAPTAGGTPSNTNHVGNNSSSSILASEPKVVDPAMDTQESGTDDLIGTIQPVGDVELSETASIEVSVRSWGIDRIDQVNLPLDGVYSPGDLDGRGVHVYVIDTGVLSSHYDFRGRVGDGTSMLGGSYLDDNGHGTHVAGTVLGALHGIARNAILHPVKVLGRDGSGSYTNIINGMRWAKNHVQSNGIRAAVVSMSLGGPRSAALNDAVEDLAAAGIPVVVSAGNSQRADACTTSPASAPSAITVGASTDQDALASFSNIGACLTMFAPGTYITSAGTSSDTAEATMSGTSMAAPHVSGAVAMYLQSYPGASVSTIKRALLAAGVQRTFDSTSPRVLLNAIASRLRGTTSQPRPSPTPSPVPSSSAPARTASPAPLPAFPTLAPPAFCMNCPFCLFCK